MAISEAARRVEARPPFKRAVIFFAKGHAAAGRADDGQFGLETRGLRQRFAQGENHHPRDAMQTLGAELRLSGAGQTRVGDLPGGLAPAMLDREAGDR